MVMKHSNQSVLETENHNDYRSALEEMETALHEMRKCRVKLEALKNDNGNDILSASGDEENRIMSTLKKAYLDMHPYKPWVSKDGKFCVRIPDNTKPRGFAIRRRNSREEIEDLIVQFQKGQEYSPTLDEVFKEWNDRRLQLGKIKAATHTRCAVYWLSVAGG